MLHKTNATKYANMDLDPDKNSYSDLEDPPRAGLRYLLRIQPDAGVLVGSLGIKFFSKYLSTEVINKC